MEEVQIEQKNEEVEEQNQNETEFKKQEEID